MITKRREEIQNPHAWNRRAAKRTALVFLLLCLASLAIVAVVYSHHAHTLRNATTASAAHVPFIEAALRPKYPYSVIPGGVYSPAELQQAIKRDPTLRAHYAGFDVKNSRLVRLTEDRYGYVSYKLKNQIFWTRRRLKLSKGEVLLSDGSNYVRCRCGNRISEKAQGGVAPAEPLDALLSLPPITLDNLRNFDFAEAPRVTDENLPPILDRLRAFDMDALQDTSSDARIKLANPAPHAGPSPWLGALPLAALPLLALDRGHSAINPNSFNSPGQGGNGGQPNFPPGPPHHGNNPPFTPPVPPVSSEPEPIELGVELLVATALIGTKLALSLRRRPQ